MNETRRNRVTLADLLAIIPMQDHILVVRRLGPHECEAVASGTIRELRSSQCEKACGDSIVESLTTDADGWLGTLIITVMEKETNHVP